MVNLQVLVGNVGKAELKYISNGTALFKMSVATTESYQKDGEWKKLTTWHNVQAWGKFAESLGQRVQTGDLVFVQGRLDVRQFEGQDGQKRYSYDTRADQVRVLRHKNGGAANGGESVAAGLLSDAAEPEPPQITEDDVPF